jgi:ribonuclease HI
VARRRDFAHVANGIDRWATKRVLSGGVKGRPPLPPDAAGALRTVICGNVVTERVAAHWTSRSMCPHCRLEEESHEHRFWRCPAWDGARTRALGAPGASMTLRAALDDGVARTGVLAAQPELIALADAASQADPQLPMEQPRVEGPRRTVWSDGSCIHPLDPLMARAAWGIRVEGNEGAAATDMAGPVDGAQTAQRAEVTAALAAVRAVPQPIELVSDNRWVVRGIASIAGGAVPAEWRHADLWKLLEGYVRQGRVRARWTPAHKSAEEYARRGLHEHDRLGNNAAYANAGGAAGARIPPPRIMQQRERQLELLADAQRVIAFTELAALKANHGNGVAAPRVKRTWADVRRGVQAARRATLHLLASLAGLTAYRRRHCTLSPWRAALCVAPVVGKPRFAPGGRRWLMVGVRPRQLVPTGSGVVSLTKLWKTMAMCLAIAALVRSLAPPGDLRGQGVPRVEGSRPRASGSYL